MAMTRSLLGRVLRRSSIPLLPSQAASSSPSASRFLGGAMKAPFSSANPAAAAARSVLGRPGFSPPMALRSYWRSSGSSRALSTKGGIKGTDDGMLVKLIKRFLKKIGHPSQFTVPEAKEWMRNHKGWKNTNPSGPVFSIFTGGLVVVLVEDNWKKIKGGVSEFAGGLTGSVQRNVQDKD